MNPGEVPEFSFIPVDDGVYTVTLSISDDKETVTESRQVTISNRVPESLDLRGATSLRVGDAVQLSGSFTDAGIADQWKGSIDFGDEFRLPLLVNGGHFSVPHVYVTPSSAGPFTAVVRVWDDDM